MASQTITLKAAGLQTYYQTLMDISPGALLKANNTIINREGIIEPRRGLKEYSAFEDKLKQLIEYKNTLISHSLTKLQYDNNSGVFTSFIKYGTSQTISALSITSGNPVISGFTIGNIALVNVGDFVLSSNGAIPSYAKVISKTSIAPYTVTISSAPTTTNASISLTFRSPINESITEPVSGYRIKYTEAKSNLYFTTNEGVKKISAKSSIDFSIPNIIEDSGGPKAIAGTVTLNNTTPHILAHKFRVSYRILWIYTDRNDNLIFGAPSAPMTVTNTTGGDRTPQLTFPLPYDVDSTSYKYRIYRSEIVPDTSTPSDEMYQVYEATVTFTDLSTRSITVSDFVSESLRLSGVPLYTNQYSGEGILKSNEPPPAANDIALFKGHMFYANTRTRYSSIITLVNNTGLSGQTITIGSNVYTFGATENIATKTVLIGADIEATANSLVRVVNGDANEIVSAYYLSVFGETPGKIFFQRKTLVNSTFNITSTVGAKFSPDLSTTLVSSNEVVGNRLYYSKYQEHEAVPLLNYIDIGSKDEEITRIVPLRESLFVFKGDGVFRLAGDPGVNPTWDIGVFDNTSILKAPDTAVTLGNQCYYFSNQGVMRLNESSLENISKPIDDKLLSFLSIEPVNDYLSQVSFSIGYESDKALLLWTVSKRTDTEATVCYRYNTSTQTWTEWQITKTCGLVSKHRDKLFLGAINAIPEIELEPYSIEVERKEFNRFDYADREYLVSVNTFGLIDNIMNLSQNDFKKISIGDVIVQTQYVTIYQFNTLLKKLDIDNGIPTNNFYELLKISSGDSLTLKMYALVAKLNTDLSTSAFTFSGTLDFQTIQVEYNTIIDTLNSSPLAIFSNYQKSGLNENNVYVAKTTSHEAIVVSTDRIRSRISLNVIPSFLIGPTTSYKAIRTEVEYAPQHAGDPVSFKQFSSGTFMFKRRSFYTAQVGYNSDVSDNYEEIDFVETYSGIFGGTEYGNGSTWGGNGDQAQIRTYIPMKKQRCRFLGCKFYHSVALESFELYGLSLSFRVYAISNRDYR